MCGGGPTLTFFCFLFFLVDARREDQNAYKQAIIGDDLTLNADLAVL